MDLQGLEWMWYTPAFEGNRETAEPMSIEMRRPSFGYARTYAGRLSGTHKERVAAERALFVDHTRAIRGLSLNGQPVLTGADLWRLGAEENKLGPELFIELLQALDDRTRFAEGTASGFSGPSGAA